MFILGCKPILKLQILREVCFLLLNEKCPADRRYVYMFSSFANAFIPVFTQSAGLKSVITDHTQQRYFPRHCCFLNTETGFSPLCAAKAQCSRTRSWLWTNTITPSPNMSSTVLFLPTTHLHFCFWKVSP